MAEGKEQLIRNEFADKNESLRLLGNLVPLVNFENRESRVLIKDPEMKAKVQAEIRSLQERANAEIERVRKNIENEVEDPFQDSKDRAVGYDGATKSHYVFGKGGVRVPITQGQIFSTIFSGERYKAVGGDKVWNLFLDYMQTFTLVRNTSFKITALLESKSWYNEGSSARGGSKADAYEAISEKVDLPAGELKPGELAEQVYASYMTRVLIDNFVDKYLALQAPPEYDVEYKIDLLLIDRLAKVNNQPVGLSLTHGIQYLSNSNPEKISVKEKQLWHARKAIKQNRPAGGRLVDVHLVDVEIPDVKNLYNTWRTKFKSREVVGGPDELLDRGTQEQMFKKTMRAIVGEEEASKLWEQIK